MKITARVLIILFFFAGFGDCRSFAENKKIALVKSPQVQFYDEFLSGFKSGLASGQERCDLDEYEFQGQATIDKIKNKNYELICVLGTGAAKAIKKNVTDKPIVFSMVLNPVSSGVVDNLIVPGANITGVSLDVDVGAQLGLIKKISGSVKRVGVVYSNQTQDTITKAKTLAGANGLQINAINVDSSVRIPAALEELKGKVDILWLVPDLLLWTKDSLSFIINYSVQNKLPAMVFAPYLVKAGGLFAYDYDYGDIGKQTADVIERILEGEAPGSMEVGAPRKIRYSINVKVAEYLGIKFSSTVIGDAESVYR